MMPSDQPTTKASASKRNRTMERPFLSHVGTTILALILMLALPNTVAADVDVRVSEVAVNTDIIYHRGDSLWGYWRVYNLGDEPSDSYTADFYAGDYQIGSGTYSGLGPGQTSTRSLVDVCTLPDNIPLGNYTIRMEISCSNDSNPSDNWGTGGDITVAEIKPADLHLQELRVSNRPHNSIYHPGDSVHVSASIEHLGDEPAGSFTADVYADDYLIASTTEEDKSLFHVYCDLPDDFPLGEYTIRMEITCDNDSNPDNNSASDSSPITVGPLASDLWLYEVELTNEQADGLFHPGESISIRCRVWNVGQAISDSYTAEFYIDAYFLGSVERGSVDVDEYDIFTEIWELTEDIPEGRYTPSVSITCSNDDDTHGGSNSQEDRYGSFEFARKVPPEITVQTVDAVDGVYKPGDSIAVAMEIECGNGQLSGDLEVDFYASADKNISVADYKIQSDAFSDLQPGDSYSFDTICRFPSDIPDGNYYVGVVVTHPDDIGEYCDPKPVWVSPPMDPAAQTVRATAGTYSPGDQIKVYSLVKNIGQRTCESYAVNYYLSTDTTITTADYKIGYVDRTGLAPGQQHSYETTCRLPVNTPAGDCYIGIIITCPKDYDTTNDVGRASTTVEVVHPAGYVCGRATYKDKRNQEQPIRYALVQVHAEDNNNDPLDDPLLGQTHTNGEGLYGLILANDGNSGRDIYVKVISEGVSGAYPGTTSRICTLKDAVLDEVYALVSDPHPHPRDSSAVIDLVSPRFEGGEFMVFDSIVEGFSKAKTLLNIELDELRAYWPGEDKVSYFDPDEMKIYISQDDRGDRDVIMHEYAHFIADVYGIAQGEVGDDSTHYWDQDLRSVPSNRTDEQAMNLAFREAWPTWFSICAQYGDTDYPYSGDSMYDDEDEDGRWTLRVDLDIDGELDYSPGQYFENMNAATLWDIFDDKNDGAGDTLSDLSLEKVWTISRDYKIENILDFWDNWFKKYDYREEMYHIFKLHELPHDKPPPEPSTNQPPVVDIGGDMTVYQTFADGARVTLTSENCYDPDGDELVDYQWHAGWAWGRGRTFTLDAPPGETTVTLTLSDGKMQAESEIVLTVIPTDPSTWER